MTKSDKQKDLLSLYMFVAELTFGPPDVPTQQYLAVLLISRFPDLDFKSFKRVWKAMAEDYGQMEELETRFYHAMNCVRRLKKAYGSKRLTGCFGDLAAITELPQNRKRDPAKFLVTVAEEWGV
jgi:hypothetical protein